MRCNCTSTGLRSRVRSHYRSHKMSVWLRLIPQLHQPGDEGVLLSHHHLKPGPLHRGNMQDAADFYDGNAICAFEFANRVK